MNVGRRKKGMDAAQGGRFDCTGGGLDINRLCASQRRDAYTLNLSSNRADRFEVATGGDRKACFDDVNAQIGKLVRKAQFFSVVHGAAGRLFSVAEGGVEEDDLVWIDHRLCHSR